jgi:hypothetical protein
VTWLACLVEPSSADKLGERLDVRRQEGRVVDEQLMALVTEEHGLALEAPWTTDEQRRTLCATAVGGASKESLGDDVVFGRMGTSRRSVRSVVFASMQFAVAKGAPLNVWALGFRFHGTYTIANSA